MDRNLELEFIKNQNQAMKNQFEQDRNLHWNID